MITKLLNEVNEKIETLNNLVQDKEYFEKLDERIEKVNNYVQEQKQEIERLNNIIEDFEEELEREVNIKEENTGLEHNTYIDINNTLKTVLKRFRELKGSDKE